MHYQVEIRRYVYTQLTTMGILSVLKDGKLDRNCFTLEDKVRLDGVKVQDKTAIWGSPQGIEYPLRINHDFGMAKRYKKLWPSWHKGIIHIDEVPDFTYILIHCGRTHENTRGCPLVGSSWRTAPNAARKIRPLAHTTHQSPRAYHWIYPSLHTAVSNGATLKVYNC